MNTSPSASGALERARLAYEQMQRREYNAAMKRRARARARNIALALAFGIAVSAGIGLSIYNGWMPDPARSSAKDKHANSKSGEAETVKVRSFVKDNTCQELQFSSQSGVLVGGTFVPCRNESKREPLPPPTGEVPIPGKRINSIRDSFGR
jgi:hypothetical protein